MEKYRELFSSKGNGGKVRELLHKHDIHHVGAAIDNVCDDVGLVLNLRDFMGRCFLGSA